jgi:hypothetical protein
VAEGRLRVSLHMAAGWLLVAAGWVVGGWGGGSGSNIITAVPLPRDIIALTYHTST